jgi:hypothetical protein
MRKIKTLLLLFLSSQLLQAQNNDTVKEEIKALLQQLNQARLKHDRAALEKLYAKEFVNVHSSGFIDDRETTIHEIVTTDSIRQLPIPSLDNLLVYGDVAILKPLTGTSAGTVNATRIAGVYVYVKKEGRWQIAHAQGTPLQRERQTISPDASVLKSYAGKYERNPGELIIIEMDGNFLLLNVSGRGIPKRKLVAVSDTNYFDKLGTEYNFSRDASNITLTIKLQGGQESKWRKIE